MLLLNKSEQAWNVFDQNSIECFEMYVSENEKSLLVQDSPFFKP